MIGPEARAALRALRDVGAVSAAWDHRGYRALIVHRFATRTPCETGWLYRLTPRGRDQAARMFDR